MNFFRVDSPNPTFVYIKASSHPSEKFFLTALPVISNLPLAFYQRQPGPGYEMLLFNFFPFLRDSSLFHFYHRRDDGSKEKKIISLVAIATYFPCLGSAGV